MTILVVDDLPENSRLLRAQLEAEGHAVIEAFDGVEALAVLENTVVDAMISDILMPRMDGYRLCTTCRGQPSLQGLPIIIYTATYTAPADEKLAFDAGADCYLRKPASVSVIVAALNEAMALPPGRHHGGAARMPEAELMREYSERLVNKLEQKNTELAEANAHLQASEERWRTIIATDPECVKIVSMTGELLEMNPAGLAMLDATTLAEVKERPLLEWVAAEHRTAFANLHRSVMLGEQSQLEFEVVSRTGTRRWLRTIAAPLRDAHGVITSMLGITRDITGEREREAQLRQSQKMEAIGQLAGGIAHDFNNVLSVIQGFAMLLLEGESNPDRMRTATQHVIGAAERAADLTRQLLAFGRRQAMQPQFVDLNVLANSLAKMVQRVLGEDIKLHLNPSPEPLVIHADRGMIDQILMNLVINARDAMPNGGVLEIHTNRGRGPNGDTACVSVVDSGTGIAPECLPRIFEPFFTTKELGKGSGLGLATAFGIAAQHGGRIDVSSTVGKGSTFTVVLPLTTASVPSTRATEAAPIGGKETILVVEDEPSVRMLTRAVLERAGYQVHEAASGVEALRMWDDCGSQIDLVLTDVVMPDGVSGRDLANQLQARRANLRVVFTSGYSADFGGREIHLDPGQSFLQKPATPDQMRAAVRRALDAPDAG